MTVFLLFLLGLFLLIMGAKFFVESSEKIARSYGVSELVIGMIIVGCGTSLPELFISSTASFTGHGSVALANVVGSNIANIALIGGVLILMLGVLPSHDFGKKDMIFFVLSNSLLLAAVGLVWLGGSSLLIAVSMSLFLLGLLMYYLWGQAHIHQKKIENLETIYLSKKDWILGTLGFLLLIGGSHMTVSYLEPLALSRGVSEYVIAVVLVAVGTSLPELVTSLIAIGAGSKDIAFGNIIGSNIFNMLGVLPVASLFGEIFIEHYYFMDGLMMAVCCLILVLLLRARSLHVRGVRGVGLLLLLLYGGYVWWMMYTVK